jgi:ADP-dependent NAD(P)H-hydrate dehydratase / NAD(P)H-hydrate epimerase
MKFCFAHEMRRLDEKTIHECGIPGIVLMENAARGAADFCREYMGDLQGLSAIIMAGRGNNGGDGLAMARIFHGWGARVRVFLLGEKTKVSGDARINLDAATRMGIAITEIKDEAGLNLLDLHGADLIVDAILGTGLNSDVRGLFKAAIERINRHRTTVMAVDIPSGVDSDSGRVWGTAVRADFTATFGLPKAGLLLNPGENLAGRVKVIDIGLPPHIMAEADPGKELIDASSLKGVIPVRNPDDHKGRFGHALLVAGSTGKTGAAALAAQSVVRSGAGLVTLACPASLNPILETKVTEAMTEPLAEELPGFVSEQALERVLSLSVGKSVLAIGPGLGSREGATRLVQALVTRADVHLVIDADGLNALQGSVDLLKQACRDVVLTPHPGEMSRLTGLNTSEIAEDRLGIAARFSQEFGVIVVLKGRRSVVALPNGRLFLNTSGGPHMASGGMGDVLTGMIAGLISQGVVPADATRLGVFAHGLAADRAALKIGGIGLAASDLLVELPRIWSDLAVNPYSSEKSPPLT